MDFLFPIFFSSFCFFIVETSYVQNELEDRNYAFEQTRNVGQYPNAGNLIDKESSRQERFLKKLGFLSGIKVGSSFPSQSSGQLIATHNGNFLGRFLNANIRLIYGSQPLLGGGIGGVGAVIPPVTTVTTGGLKGGPDAGAQGTPGFILIPLRRDPSVTDKNNTDDKLSVESILIPVYEKVGTVKIPELAAAATNERATTTTENPPVDIATNVAGTSGGNGAGPSGGNGAGPSGGNGAGPSGGNMAGPSGGNGTATDTFFIL
nr:PREDICTED: uncharacterized transmembrane protein DDB_G0289901-like [Bemisia tabaci]